jgi:hypothetical protein
LRARARRGGLFALGAGARNGAHRLVQPDGALAQLGHAAFARLPLLGRPLAPPRLVELRAPRLHRPLVLGVVEGAAAGVGQRVVRIAKLGFVQSQPYLLATYLTCPPLC